MIIFIGIAAFIALLAVIGLIYPLLRSKKNSSISFEKSNIDIYRDQLQVLENDLSRGIITQVNFESARDELQLRLLNDTKNKEIISINSSNSWNKKYTAYLLGLSIPVLALVIYSQSGNYNVINHKNTAKIVNSKKIEQMVNSLAAKLHTNPNNPAAWLVLARSYKVMGRLEESKKAFESAGNYLHNDPDVLVDYASVLGAINNNKLDGQAAKIIDEALTINPNHPNALMLSGISAYQRSDYSNAAKQWQKLFNMLDPNSDSAQQIQLNIIDAQVKSKLPIDNTNILTSTNDNVKSEIINQLINKLKIDLKNNPNNYSGWVYLANTYKNQGKLEEAIKSFEKSGPLLETNADIISQYADLLAKHNHGSFQGKPLKMINQALKLDPKQPNALMMAAQAAYQEADYKTAIHYWETVLALLPNDSPYNKLISTEITNTKYKLKTKTSP